MTRVFAALILVMVVTVSASSQTTAFTYQGGLNASGTPANGNHDFEFALFDSLAGGSQLGTTLTRAGVTVVNGVFSVSLDFGNHFPGANRFLEIRVRPSGQPSMTVLSPRQQVTSSPYSLRTLVAAVAGTATSATNAIQLGGVAADQYVLTGDTRLTNPRAPTAGSGHYIQNQDAGPQASSNFNISGNGTAAGTLKGNVVDTATHYSVGGTRMFVANGQFTDPDFGAPATNVFAGYRAGFVTAPDPTPGSTLGRFNSIFGTFAGDANTSGRNNSFFGARAGFRNSTGNDNTLVGYTAGGQTTTGNKNTFIGLNAGFANVTGSSNTIVGEESDVGSNNLTNATAIGSRAFVTTSNSLILGSINGVNGAMANTNVGIGTTSPADRLDVVGSIRVSSLGPAGATTLCRNASNQISSCSSSGRYKSNINTFTSGLDLIKRLRPVSFNWRDGGMVDVGLVAEEVEKVEPLLTTTNDTGQVEGVKYDRVGVVLVNAVKEQQLEIDALRKTNAEQNARIEKQQTEIEALKRLVCSGNAKAEICKRR